MKKKRMRATRPVNAMAGLALGLGVLMLGVLKTRVPPPMGRPPLPTARPTAIVQERSVAH